MKRKKTAKRTMKTRRTYLNQTHACVAEINCPECGATAGSICLSKNGQSARSPHSARYKAWKVPSNRTNDVPVTTQPDSGCTCDDCMPDATNENVPYTGV